MSPRRADEAAGRETAKRKADNVMPTETNCTECYSVINLFL